MGLHAVVTRVAIMVAVVERPLMIVVPLPGVRALLEIAVPLGLIATDLLLLDLRLGWQVWSFSFCFAAFTAVVGNAGVQTLCHLRSHLWWASIRTLHWHMG